MPKPRFSEGRVSMRNSSSQMLPPESGSSPAMQFNAVVLPQPEGPSSAANSPRGTVSESSLSAATRAPLGLLKWRDTASSRSSLKSCLMEALLRLLRADLLVPLAECIDQALGVERLRMRKLGDPIVGLGPA